MKKTFRRHETSFSDMDWSPRSSNLYPVEKLWDVLERADYLIINATLNGNKYCGIAYVSLFNNCLIALFLYISL